MTSEAVAQRFDRAAGTYDGAAGLQAEVAQRLVAWAAETLQFPNDLLDLGCGTGFVTVALNRQYPQAQLTALDAAPAMLQEAQRKVPRLNIVAGDAAKVDLPQRFDAIFSSMMLHWLGDPADTLRRWQKLLKPSGHLFVAVPVTGSFQEWRALCRKHDVEDGLWPLSPTDFADGLAAHTELQDIVVPYMSAHRFLRRIKAIGGATSRIGHKPASVPVMRRLLEDAAMPFHITYRMLYIEMQSGPSS